MRLIVFFVMASGVVSHMIDPPSVVIVTAGMVAALRFSGASIPIMPVCSSRMILMLNS